MANSQFYQFTYSKDAALTILNCSFVAGASGAVTALQGSGIASITRSAAGTYVVALAENYNKLLNVNVQVQRPDLATTSGIRQIEVGAEAVASATAPSVTILTELTGVPADPAAGSKIMISLVLRNSSVKGKGE